MLQDMNILIIGGDDRYLHVLKKLLSERSHITVVGYSDEVLTDYKINNTIISEVDFSLMDVIILPVEGIDQAGKVHSYYLTEEIQLTATMFANTPAHCTIFTGTANNLLRKYALEANRDLITLFERDDIAIANSIPTAEATLQIAMEKTTTTIHGSNVLIIGFGRVGKTIARLFHQVGANITVAARKDGDMARIQEMTYQHIHIDNIQSNLANLDIIINTVPTPVLKQKELSIIQPTSIIIDIASKPGGTDFETAERLGITAIHALGLPGKVAPTTSGNIIANVIITLLKRTI